MIGEKKLNECFRHAVNVARENPEVGCYGVEKYIGQTAEPVLPLSCMLPSDPIIYYLRLAGIKRVISGSQFSGFSPVTTSEGGVDFIAAGKGEGRKHQLTIEHFPKQSVVNILGSDQDGNFLKVRLPDERAYSSLTMR